MRLNRIFSLSRLSSLFVVFFSGSILCLSYGQEKIQECHRKEEEAANGACRGAASSLGGRAPPQILSNGALMPVDPSFFQKIDGNLHPLDDIINNDEKEERKDAATVANIPGGESISLQYVQNFITPEISSKLIQLCDNRNGWTLSPQEFNGSAAVNKATRTSSSCPLIWPQLYLPLLHDPNLHPSKKARLDPVREEIELVWELTQRVASFLKIEEEYVEPFQIVRYQPGQLYKEHHDHGKYYGKGTEQRSWTFLVFLTDVPALTSEGKHAGGYTKFRALGGDDNDGSGLSFVPRMGDGVLWRNEDEATGEVLMDAIHEAVPPLHRDDVDANGNSNVVVKYAMNVWIAKEKIQDNLDVSSYRTR